MYLFDTDAVTNIFKKNPSEKFLNKITGLKMEEQFISSITIGEIAYGAFKSRNPDIHLYNLENLLLRVVNVVFFDIEAAYIYGKIRAGLEEKGKIVSDTDMQIASIAIANNLILITGNIKHFQNINGLYAENWLV